MSKRILLIGGAGYVGAELQKTLAMSGYKVRVFDIFWYPKGRWDQNSFPQSINIEYIQGDVRNLELLTSALDEVDTVIHLACISNDPSFELDPNLAYEINYKAFKNFIPILNKSKVKRFIFASSSSVYGVKSEPEVTEELTLNPLTDYSKFKIECESIMKSEIRDDIVQIIFRPSTVCGHSRRQRFDLVVNILTLSALTKGEILVHGGSQFRPNLHIKDMVNSYLLAIEADSKFVHREIFNVAGENMTVKDIAEKVQSVISSDLQIEFLPVNDERSYRVSGAKIASILGFRPQHTVDEAIKDIQKSFTNGIYGDTNQAQYYNLRVMKEISKRKAHFS